MKIWPQRQFNGLVEGVGFVCPPLVDECGHVFRPLAIEEESFTGTRMGEAERLGMQHLSRTEGEAVFDKLAVFLRTQSFEDFASAVFLITKEWVPYMLHMHAYLVCASCFQSTLDERDIRELLEHSPVGDSLFGLRTFLEVPYAVDSAVAVIARQGSFDCAALLLERTPDERVIGAFGGMVEELTGEVGLRFGRLSNEEQTGGIFVYTMDETDIGIIDIDDWTIVERRMLEMPGEGMEEGVLIVTMSGMDDESGGFVHHQQVIVLIDDIERYVLRRDGEIMRFMIEQDLYNITRFDAVVGCDRFSVRPHVTRVRSRLDTVAAGVGHVLGKVFVYAFFALPLVHLTAPTLKKEIRTIHHLRVRY